MTRAATAAISSDTTKNETESGGTPRFMDLLVQFMQEGFEDPDRFDRIPKGAVLIIVPTDDPELEAKELAKADRMRAEGRTVHIERIGPRRPAPPPWWHGERAPTNLRAALPTAESLLRSGEAKVVYDQFRDVLLVSERQGQQAGLAWPLKAGPLVLVGAGSNRAFAYIVPDFVAREVPRRPHLAAILALAESRQLSQDDVGDFELPAVRETDVVMPAHSGRLFEGDPDELIEAFRELTGEANANCFRTHFFQGDVEPTPDRA